MDSLDSTPLACTPFLYPNARQAALAAQNAISKPDPTARKATFLDVTAAYLGPDQEGNIVRFSTKDRKCRMKIH